MAATFTTDQVGVTCRFVINDMYAISANTLAKVKNMFTMPSLAMAVA